jgi:uncharacterized protein YdcH (DUF465 family)
MMHIPRKLTDEFPDETVLITRLTKTNYLFRRAASRYDTVNRQIFRIESEEELTADEVLERLKKERLKLKDQIARMLTRTERRM